MVLPHKTSIFNHNHRVHYYDTKETQLLWGHKDIVMSLDTYGPFLASGSKDNKVKWWKFNEDIRTYDLLCTFQGNTLV